MKIEDVIKIFKIYKTSNKNDNRTIVEHKNNIINGIEIGVVLSKIEKNEYEVFLHSKYKNEVISQIYYKKYKVKEEAFKSYRVMEQYITDNQLDKIVFMIENNTWNNT